MSAPEERGRDWTAEELADIVPWLDGQLDPLAAAEFERRLANDPALAARVEEVAGLDALLRRRTPAAMNATRRRWTVGVGLAAAALLLVALLPTLWAPRPPRFDVALAEGFALAEDWTRAMPELRGARAPGIAVARGEAARALDADEFLRASDFAEAAVARHALEQGRAELDAGYFVVPIELSEPASVVIYAQGPAKSAERLFPSNEVAEAALPEGRALLPGPRARRAGGATLLYSPGFLVPLGVESYDVLVAVRRAPILAEELQQLDRFAAAHNSVDLRSELTSRGFALRSLRVREPR